MIIKEQIDILYKDLYILGYRQIAKNIRYLYGGIQTGTTQRERDLMENLLDVYMMECMRQIPTIEQKRKKIELYQRKYLDSLLANIKNIDDTIFLVKALIALKKRYKEMSVYTEAVLEALAPGVAEEAKAKGEEVVEHYMTRHAKLRFDSRFHGLGFTEEAIMKDVKKYCANMTLSGKMRFKVIGELGEYVIGWDGAIITMYPSRFQDNKTREKSGLDLL